MAVTNPNLTLFASLFKGREDVFAKRWEAKDKSGYAPAYDIDWSYYSLHKARGGTLKDYPHKSFTPLTESCLKSHIEGKEVIGIYPLLQDNTSWFAAVDFDESNWQAEIRNLFTQCTEHGLPVYIERSRSGNGGHLWIFFAQPYPASKSRAILKSLLAKSGINNKTNRSSSYDRIFPNQDYHAGKGMGNLIALPLQLKAMESGNSCFIDPQTFEPFRDQWHFLSTIERVNTDAFDCLYKQLTVGTSIPLNVLPLQGNDEGIEVTLSATAVINRNNLPPETVTFLRDSLKVSNPNYFMRKATGKSTYGIASSATLLEEHADYLIAPRGYIGTLLRYCRNNNLQYHLVDRRNKLPEVDFEIKGQLYDYQQPVLARTEQKEMGVIVAPPGSGKTIIGLSVIAQKRQPTLIIVHRRQLLDQWILRIQSYLGIPRHAIGVIAKGKADIGTHVTVAMIQSLDKEVVQQIAEEFGTVLIDECHHTPSESFREVLRQLHTYYLYGLTATPIRKNKDEQMIFAQIGEIIHEVKLPADRSGRNNLLIHIRDTDFVVPFNSATDNFEMLSDILIHDTTRNALIADDIRYELNCGKSIIVLTERKAHIEVLNQFLKPDCETVTLSGDDSEQSRKAKMHLIAEGRFQVLISTGQLLGEGTDFGGLDCLFLTYPCAFEGKLVQYLGRVQRGEHMPVIYDYRDLNIAHLERMFQKRNRYYQRLTKAGHIKPQEECFLKFEGDRFYLGSQANAYPVSILDLGMEIKRFKDNVIWKVRVLNFDESTGRLFTEVISYNAALQEGAQQTALPLLPIEQISFRTIDTSGLLVSVVLKPTNVSSSAIFAPLSLVNEGRPIHTPARATTPVIQEWWLFEKTIKVPFKKVQFGHGFAAIFFYLTAIGSDVRIEMPNEHIRAEFEAVKDYFPKILKAKSATVTLKVKHNKKEMLSYEASSEEIAAINGAIIDSVKFEFVRKDFTRFKGRDDAKAIQTFDDLKQGNPEVSALMDNEAALLGELLKMESARHFLQIRYLAARHEASVLKLRFILQPFSFIFLVSGERKYHLIWETLDSEEASYLWHIDKSREALRSAVNAIEADLNEMRRSGRNAYIKKAPEHFSRIIHDYTDLKKGFIEWKGILEERLV